MSFKVSTWKDGMKCMTKINRNRHTHAYSVWWTPQTAALVWWSGNNDGVMEATLCSMEVAASASIIAGEVGVITGFCCGSVHSVSLCIPQHEDWGIVALSNRCDTREGAGSWGNRQNFIYWLQNVCIYVLLRVGHYFKLRCIFLSTSQKCVTCLQVDRGAWLTLTFAIFSNNTEVI